MNIFVINIVAPPGMSGDRIHLWELVTNLSRLGHEIHALSYEEYKNIDSDKIRFHIIPRLAKQGFFNRLSYELRYAISLIKLIRSHNFDVLYTRAPFQMSGIVGYIAKRTMKIPLIFEINGIVFAETELIRDKCKKNIKNIFGRIEMKLRKYEEILMWKKANVIITVTDGLKRYLIRYGVDEHRISVIGNGANIELFKPMDKSEARKRLGLETGEKYVCFVGCLAPWHGVEYLIKAASLVLKNIKVKFLIVGEGIMRQELKEMAESSDLENDFIFTGNIPYVDVPKYINASDVCVAPFGWARYKKIGLSPLKIYEYMACGRPVVGSDIDGLGNFLEILNAGISFTCDNHNELADAIIKLLIDEKLAAEMGSNGRLAVLENNNWRRVAEKVEKVCKDVKR